MYVCQCVHACMHVCINYTTPMYVMHVKMNNVYTCVYVRHMHKLYVCQCVCVCVCV